MFIKILLISFAITIIIAGCNDSSTNTECDGKITDHIQKIEIPFRESGYSQFPSIIINSKASLDSFLAETTDQSNWNQRTEFLEGIQDANIDFEKWNLLLYRITESSGSVQLSVGEDISIDANKITIPIKRVVPEIGTTDLAYYALAYQISKSIEEIIFDDQKQKVEIENQATDMIIPKNCKAWFDGCNSCGRVAGGEIECTEMDCVVSHPEDFICTAWN